MTHRILRLTRLIIILGAFWIFCFTCRFDFIHVVPIAQDYLVQPTSRIAKATVAVNSLNSTLINRALRSHQVQNDIHGYMHFIASNDLVSDFTENDAQKRPRGAWSKPAYILSILVDELTKPESERLEWVFWFDADTIVINPHTPLEIFVPPKSIPELSNVHLLIAANWDGLNSGAFAVRVDQWSVSLLSAVLAYPIYNHKIHMKDRFRDQSAFQWLLQSKDSPMAARPMKGRENWVEVPMRWFNSLPVNNAFAKNGDWIFNHNMSDALFDKGTNEVYNDGWGNVVKPWKVMQGDMAVHFAGTSRVRNSWMEPWLARAEANLPAWGNVTKQVDLKTDAEAFWINAGKKIASARQQGKANSNSSAPASAKNSKVLTDVSAPKVKTGSKSSGKQ